MELKDKEKVAGKVMTVKEVKVQENFVEENLQDGGSLRKRKYNKVIVYFSWTTFLIQSRLRQILIRF